jgi:hypothetical protein
MNCLKNITLFVFLFLIVSCEKEIGWKTQNDKKDFLIVDGIITNELKPQKIKLTHSYQEINTAVSPYTGANVYVSDGSATYQFTEDATDRGNYHSQPFRALTGRNYILTIESDTTTFAASAMAVAVAPLPDVAINKPDATGKCTYLYLKSPFPTMTEVYYNWSFDTDYCNSYGYCFASETYYTLNNVDVSDAFKPDKQIITFPAGTTIIRKNYSLTDAHQSFLRSLLMETDWRGGLFDVQAGNVKTNISNGAKGFFAVCMVVSDTTIIK